MKTTNEIAVEYVDHMGSDLSVVNSARVSFNKKKDIMDASDEKLIKYLAKHNHWSPFAHTSLCLKVTAPIFVARQLVKHQVGGVWNEISRRYVSDNIVYYVPDAWRSAPINMKQGSGDKQYDFHVDDISDVLELCTNRYNELLEKGVAPEQARMILPINLMTEWYWTGSLVFWERVCKLRLDPHAQQECRDVAVLISDICLNQFPCSWNALFMKEI